MRQLCSNLSSCRRNKVLVCGVGFAFLAIFSAFGAASQATESVLEETRKEKGSSFMVSGYVSLAIVYAACAIFNWISPTIVSFVKPKYAMFVGSVTYVFFLTAFFEPIAWLIYFASAVLGCGAAILWTAQGVYITACSTATNLNRNFGIFWIIFTISNLLGGAFNYFLLSNVISITSHSRYLLYGVFTAICTVGCVFLLMLPLPKMEMQDTSESDSTVPLQNNQDSAISVRSTIAKSFHLCLSPCMLAILLATCFTGINLAFYSGVYGTCLGRMQVFGEKAKSYIGLSGIFVGVGEIVGGQLTAVGGNRIRPTFIMMFGFLTAILSAISTFLMVPPEAPIKETSATGFIEPSVYLAMVIGTLLGLNDSLWNTQISALIGKIYPTNADSVATAAAFALFKFIQSVTSAIAFFYSSVLLLHWQLLIFMIFAILGISGFLYADRRSTSSLSVNITTTIPM
ncbi:unnamed protein product [Hymenolepis diminuta]|uniref:UNC93-like protein MFSD11 n=1 Tax=Hymenolepis diminuta TaxID=6216 RepID=A0A564Z945_HYMDI|nr:unnamed protein product [Hymenolepis diminuta]